MGKMYTRNPLMKGFTEGFFTTKDNVKLRYLNKGTGTPLIMIPGASSSADYYSLNAPEFSKEHAVYVLEMRGHGYSDCPSHGARISRLAADVHEFIQYLNAPKVNMLGFSMGCSVIWSYIDLFGEEVFDKLIFVDEPPSLLANPIHTEKEMLTYGGNRMDLWYFYNSFCNDPEKAMLTAVPACFTRGILEFPDEIIKTMPDNYAEKLEQIPKDPPLNGNFLAALIKDHISLDWRDIFPQISTPVLLITGDVSHAVPQEAGEWMSNTLQHCKWVRFSMDDFGSHNLLQYSYKKFNGHVMKFLEN